MGLFHLRFLILGIHRRGFWSSICQGFEDFGIRVQKGISLEYQGLGFSKIIICESVEWYQSLCLEVRTAWRCVCWPGSGARAFASRGFTRSGREASWWTMDCVPRAPPRPCKCNAGSKILVRNLHIHRYCRKSLEFRVWGSRIHLGTCKDFRVLESGIKPGSTPV